MSSISISERSKEKGNISEYKQTRKLVLPQLWSLQVDRRSGVGRHRSERIKGAQRMPAVWANTASIVSVVLANFLAGGRTKLVEREEEHEELGDYAIQ